MAEDLGIQIEPCGVDDVAEWARLREALWPDCSAWNGRADLIRQLRAKNRRAVFLARLTNGVIAGFAEASLRRDAVNGCDTSPVVFLEGIYVEAPHRRCGLASALCNTVAAWGRSLGCTEFGSDAYLDDLESHAFHRAAGFEERERVVAFRRKL